MSWSSFGRTPLFAGIANAFADIGPGSPVAAPRIHGELLMLGFEVSERTVSRSMRKRPADPEAQQRWRNLVHNHRDVLAAMDFFTVPTEGSITQQLREAFPYDAVPMYLIFDNDKKYGDGALAVIEHMGIERKQITPHSLWQNGVAELIAYYHDDRTHLGLAKGTPSMRTAVVKPNGNAKVVAHPRIGGLHHRYEWREAA